LAPGRNTYKTYRIAAIAPGADITLLEVAATIPIAAGIWGLILVVTPGALARPGSQFKSQRQVPEVGRSGGVPGLVLVMIPTRISLVDALPVVPWISRLAWGAVVLAVAREVGFPIGKAGALFVALGITAVAGRNIPIVAFLSALQHAIAATRCDRVVVAAIGGLAGISGALVSVVAGDLGSAHAVPRLAQVILCAGVAVIAGTGNGLEHAQLHRVTRVCCAFALVIALQRRPRRALVTITNIVHGARITVVAGAGLGRVHATVIRQTFIQRALVAVVAIRGHSGDTRAVNAVIADSAFRAVVTRDLQRRVLAPLVRNAEVESADVEIVTIGHFRDDACTSLAMVSLGAGVTIVTIRRVGDELTTHRRLARIGGADVAVIARQFSARNTGTQSAHVINGTQVAVIAGAIT